MPLHHLPTRIAIGFRSSPAFHPHHPQWRQMSRHHATTTRMMPMYRASESNVLHSQRDSTHRRSCVSALASPPINHHCADIYIYIYPTPYMHIVTQTNKFTYGTNSILRVFRLALKIIIPENHHHNPPHCTSHSLTSLYCIVYSHLE